MNQYQNQNPLLCSDADHANSEVQTVCIQELCQLNRGLCAECQLEEAHPAHKKITLNKERIFLNEKEQIYSQILDKLEKLKAAIGRGIDVIRKKFTAIFQPPQSLRILGMAQLNQKINKLLDLETINEIANATLDESIKNSLKELKLINYRFSDKLEKQCYDYLEAQNWREFERTIQPALQQNPQNEMLLLAKAEYLRMNGKPREAQEICEQLLRIDVKNPWAESERIQCAQCLERR